VFLVSLAGVTVTSYLIVQGLIPSVLDELSDTQGRRLVYQVVFSIYCVASVGLAYQNSYAALLILRMLQSAGASGTVALAFGVIADIAPPHKRGGYVGTAHVGWYSAPSLGPVIGGLLAEYAGWRWIFRFLAILSGVILILVILLLLETSRRVVGNGSLLATGISQSLHVLLRKQKKSRPDQQIMKREKLGVPNPLRCLRVIVEKNTSLDSSVNGSRPTTLDVQSAEAFVRCETHTEDDESRPWNSQSTPNDDPSHNQHHRDSPNTIAVVTPTRKRNVSNRTKTGCLTCRRRKKKCDETHPICEQPLLRIFKP
jgi:hypothetical protein